MQTEKSLQSSSYSSLLIATGACCSFIGFKYKLEPLTFGLISFSDVRSAEECFRWMQSYDAYADDIVNEESYMAR